MAKKTVKLTGLDEVMRNLNREAKAIENKTLAGILDACILLWRDMEGDVPLDLGNLRASFFIVTSLGEQNVAGGPRDAAEKANHSLVVSTLKPFAKGGDKPLVIIGFSASYAVFVHENMEAKFKGGKKPKFFENAIKKNQRAILKTIAENVRID